MLIYNYQKEFLGMDERDLHIFGYETFEELKSEVSDFADLFIKTPGYIHNFQHIHWIDFIQYSDEAENAKVLINANGQTFSATLKVSKLYLIDNPAAAAFAVNFHNLRTLSHSETQQLSTQISKRELPKVEVQEPKVFTPEPKESEEDTPSLVVDNYDQDFEEKPSNNNVSLDIDFNEVAEEIPSTPIIEEPQQQALYSDEDEGSKDTILDIDDLSLDVFDETTQEQAISQVAIDEPVKQIEEEFDNGYHYDPQIASQELGLPIDLIEEFIQDFILQAKEFHAEIYEAIEQEDVEKVKTLSHKLKGVAANLRIEDAHEVLSAVSASSELSIIHENLNTFYKIVKKLEGESSTEPTNDSQEVEQEVKNDTHKAEETIDDSDTFELTFKEDEPLQTTQDIQEDLFNIQDEIKEEEPLVLTDDEIPDKIEIPELADDDFFINPQENEIKDENEDTELILYSKSAAAQEIGLDIESFNELFEDFENESHAIFQHIHEAIKNDDLEKCRSEVVKFKTMSDNMRLHEFAAEIDLLLYSSDKESLTRAANKIDHTISKISKMGA